MKKKTTLFFLQMKLAFSSIPVILAGTLVLTAIIVLAAFAGVKLLSNEENTEKMRVALVIQDESKYTKMALTYLFEEESVKEMCDFVEMSEEEAGEALNLGEVFAVVIIPKNFLAGVLNGTNIPARIVLKDSGMHTQSGYFQELVNAAATDLAMAQSAVYAVDDLCRATGIDAIAESEEYLNVNLFMYALRRNTYYGQIEYSDTGDLTTVEFYAASGIVLLLLLSGVTCCDILKRDNAALLRSLNRMEVRPWLMATSKLAGVMAVYGGMLLLVYMIMAVLKKVPFSLPALVGIVVVVFAIFALNLLIFQITDSKMAGAMILFMGSIVMLFVSGNFLPEIMLPEGVNAIGNVMPTKYITRLCGQILTGEVMGETLGICALWGAAFLALTILYQKTLELRGKI